MAGANRGGGGGGGGGGRIRGAFLGVPVIRVIDIGGMKAILKQFDSTAVLQKFDSQTCLQEDSRVL